MLMTNAEYAATQGCKDCKHPLWKHWIGCTVTMPNGSECPCNRSDPWRGAFTLGMLDPNAEHHENVPENTDPNHTEK
jgi:hypothetical protein